MEYRVLLAEDDEVNQEIVRSFLAPRGDIALTIVGDGRAALEAALTQHFDLMILDQNMPYLTGDRVIRHIRAGTSINMKTPIIRFTAEAAAVAMGVSSGGAGANIAIVPKPLRSEEFVATIYTMLRGS